MAEENVGKDVAPRDRRPAEQDREKGFLGELFAPVAGFGVSFSTMFRKVATEEYGIAQEDIVIDPLAMPIGADQTVATTFFETVSRIRHEFGLNMTCGASNTSFGMPGRHQIGAAFLPMAMTAGLTSAIMDARSPEIVEAVKAADLLLGHDEWGGSWIAAHRARQAKEAAAGT